MISSNNVYLAFTIDIHLHRRWICDELLVDIDFLVMTLSIAIEIPLKLPTRKYAAYFLLFLSFHPHKCTLSGDTVEIGTGCSTTSHT